MTIQELKKLANEPKYTQAVKEVIKKEADKYGIVIPNCKCRNKWHDVIMQIYNIEKKKEVAKIVRPYINTTPTTVFRYKGTSGCKVNGKVYDQNTSTEDILALKRHKPALFEAFYEEMCSLVSVNVKAVKEAIKEALEEKEFYPDNAEGKVKEEVKDEDSK